MADITTETQIELVAIKNLIISPFNVRRQIGDITDLCNSIKSMGLLQPIIVRPVGEKLEVVVGQRRFVACKELGWDKIPAVKRKMTDREALILSLTENIQIDSLDPIDRAEGTKRLIQELEQEMSRMQAVEWVAARLGKNSSTLYDWLRLLETSEAVRVMIREKRIDTKVGARLATLPEEVQEEVAEVIHEEYLPQPRAIRVIEEVKERLKTEPTLHPIEVIKKTIESVEEYSVSVSFPGPIYKVLSEAAQSKKLTIQEIIRRAVRKYLGL